MSHDRQPHRFLPFFPTLAEIKTGSSFISDHGAMLVEQKTASGTLKMLSLNVHAPDARSSGFSANEKDEEIIQRGINTIKFLMQMIDEHALDMVLTQETYFLDSYFDKIKRNDIKKLLSEELEKRGWNLQENGDKQASKDLMVLYNAKRLTLNLAAKEEKTETDKLSHFARLCLKYYTQKLTFKLAGSDTPFTVNHVHWPHHDIPLDAEALLKTLRSSIVIGDFNNRVVIPGKVFLINNVVPPAFRNGKQGADYTDGIFMVDAEGNIHQSANVKIINFLTGQIHTDKMPDLENFTEEQKQELLKPCLFISAAKEHQSKMTDDKQTTFLESKGILLRQSTNALNQRGLAILYSSGDNNQQNLSEFLERRLEGIVINSKRLDDRLGKELNYVTFFPSDKLQDVINESHIFFNNIATLSKAVPLVQTYLDQINSEIKKIETKNPNDKELSIKKAKKVATELLKSKIAGWLTNGTAGMQNPFAHEKEMMEFANPEIAAGSSLSIFNKQIRAPRLIKLFDKLIKLDKDLVYVPLAKTIVGKATNELKKS